MQPDVARRGQRARLGLGGGEPARHEGAVVPAFVAVDTNSLGSDVLAYDVPQADTILFARGGVDNGVVYFYGAQTAYAVNMSNVIREFSVQSKLIVENYNTPSGTGSAGPTGNE